MKKKHTAVCVFLKYPQPGRVKTRLANSVGEVQACKYYEAMIDRICSETLSQLPDPFEVVLCCDPYQPRALYENYFANYAFSILMQSGRDLGTRLEHAFGTLLNSYKKVLTIGTDCIRISVEGLQQANSFLTQDSDVVIGPATDGGYYLIGLQKLQNELFKNIEWSTEHVFTQTVRAAENQKLTVHTLTELTDIDTVEQLHQLQL